MKDKWLSGVWGISFIILGAIYTLNAFDLFRFNIFFQGFWTLFIIVPCLLSIIRKGFSTGAVIGVVLGSIWLLASRGILTDGVAGKLIFPIILVIIGINIISKSLFNRQYKDRITVNYQGGEQDYTAVFGAGEYRVDNEKFYGTNLNAVFGCVTLDLRDAYIEEDVAINATAIFGGIDVLVPNNVRVKVSGIPIFGGVDDKVKNVLDESAPTIYLSVTCMFGGVDVK